MEQLVIKKITVKELSNKVNSSILRVTLEDGRHYYCTLEGRIKEDTFYAER